MQQKQREARSGHFRGKKKKIILRVSHDLLGLTVKIMNPREEKERKEKQIKAIRSREIHLGDMEEALGEKDR